MNNVFSILTPKMKMLFMDIIASLGQLPKEIKGYIFGYEGEEDMDINSGEIIVRLVLKIFLTFNNANLKRY